MVVPNNSRYAVAVCAAWSLRNSMSWIEEFLTIFAQLSICIDQILTEFGEHPCARQQARILAPGPLPSRPNRNAPSQSLALAAHSALARCDLKVIWKSRSENQSSPVYYTGSAKTITEIAALFLQLQGDFKCCWRLIAYSKRSEGMVAKWVGREVRLRSRPRAAHQTAQRSHNYAYLRACDRRGRMAKNARRNRNRNS